MSLLLMAVDVKHTVFAASVENYFQANVLVPKKAPATPEENQETKKG